jgi:hypothetical protein
MLGVKKLHQNNVKIIELSFGLRALQLRYIDVIVEFDFVKSFCGHVSI